jgi:excisionase family DNA binding protein
MQSYLSTEEAAKRLFLSVYTIRRYIREGRLKAIKSFKNYLIREDSLEQFLSAMSTPLPGEKESGEDGL